MYDAGIDLIERPLFVCAGVAGKSSNAKADDGNPPRMIVRCNGSEDVARWAGTAVTGEWDATRPR